MKLVDMTDSKSVARNSVPVQVRPLVPSLNQLFSWFFCACDLNKRHAQSVPSECRSIVLFTKLPWANAGPFFESAIKIRRILKPKLIAYFRCGFGGI